MKTNLLYKASTMLAISAAYFLVISGTGSFTLRELILSDSSSVKDFTNLIFTDTYFGRADTNDSRAIENNITNFRDSLHFNSVHVYGYDSSGGGFNSNINWYSAYIRDLMNSIHNSGLKGYYGRNKIERLSYGQRLEYEVKQTGSTRVNSGFCYDSIMSNTYETDSGKTVLHAKPYPDSGYNSPGYLCKNIYENLQHGDLIDFTQLDDSTWFIKPLMRIDSNVVDNNPNDSVVRIDVINYKGNLIRSVKILAKDFAKDAFLNYSGNYTNRYLISDSLLFVIGGTHNSNGLNSGMRDDQWQDWDNNCKVDFRVWWYGKVEVWFDKMVVDDVWGNNLFNSNLTLRKQYEDKITEEVTEFTDYIRDGSFYIDELTHSQIPCVKRVYELMKQANPAAKLNFAVTNYFNVRSYKDNSIGNREILREIQSESFNADAHEIQDILPDNIESASHDPKINPVWFYSYTDYTRYL